MSSRSFGGTIWKFPNMSLKHCDYYYNNFFQEVYLYAFDNKNDLMWSYMFGTWHVCTEIDKSVSSLIESDYYKIDADHLSLLLTYEDNYIVNTEYVTVEINNMTGEMKTITDEF